jgi:uncharacterized protein (DUF433 family)/DNA-binding transcriptional MerR regulator
MDARLEAKYTPARAGALAGVSGQTIGQWARYGFIKPTVYEGRPINPYSYYDVAHAVAVKWLRVEGFAYAEIRTAIDGATDTYGEWPLIDAPLGIARQARRGLTEDPEHNGGRRRKRGDRGVLVKREAGVYVDAGGGKGQVTLRPEFLFGVRDTLRNGGWIARELGLKQIEVDAARLGGLPTLKGRRWAVQQVAAIAADEEGRAILRNDYGLRKPEIRESVAWSDAATRLTRH